MVRASHLPLGYSSDEVVDTTQQEIVSLLLWEAPALSGPPFIAKNLSTVSIVLLQLIVPFASIPQRWIFDVQFTRVSHSFPRDPAAAPRTGKDRVAQDIESVTVPFASRRNQ